MALISCPECGGTVSSFAASCPHCGLPSSMFPDPEEQKRKKALAAALISVLKLRQHQEEERKRKTEEQEKEAARKSKIADNFILLDGDNNVPRFQCVACGKMFYTTKKNFKVCIPQYAIAEKDVSCPDCGAKMPIGKMVMASEQAMRDFRKKKTARPAVPTVSRCPKCGGTNIQVVKKGISAGGAALGWVLAGPAGMLLGGLGGSKTKRVCANCGYVFPN